MNIKLIGTILGVIALLVLLGAVGWKIVQKTESQKAGQINNFNYEYRSPLIGVGGCMRIPSPEIPARKNDIPKTNNISK